MGYLKRLTPHQTDADVPGVAISEMKSGLERRILESRRSSPADATITPYEKNEINEKSPPTGPPADGRTPYEKNEINEKSPPSAGWATITLAWPPLASVPVPKGRWERDTDGTVVATYTRAELEAALALAEATTLPAQGGE